MKLIVGRHGEAEAGPVDAERRLTEKGRMDVARMASLVERTGWKFREIRTSPVLRAVETSEIVANHLGMSGEKDIRLSPSFYHDDLIDLLCTFGQSDACIWIMHAPDIQLFVSMLVGIPDRSLYFTPGTMAALNLPLPTVRGRSMLVWKLQPELLG